jgi:hypothetical protein
MMERDESTTTSAEEPVSETDERRPTTADIALGADDSGEQAAPAAEAVADDEDERRPLLEEEATVEVRSRWEKIQGGFVDEPRRAVEEADTLVAELMQQLADSFAKERQGLEGQWDRGDDVSTEDLRIALQRYRSFFDRLLSV